MKRKLLALLVAVLTLVTLTLPAFADVIWEPNNSFYRLHAGECDFVDRNYIANGEKGYVTLYSAPNSLTQVINLVNGTTFRVAHVWQGSGGEAWGVGYIRVDNEYHEGWVALDQMALLYDHIAFEEDHGTEFTQYDGSGDQLERACLYSWPGGVYESTLEFDREHNPPSGALRRLYTDQNGLRWAFVGYYYGHRDAWLCIDDPLNEDLGVEAPLTVAQVRGESQTLVDPAQPSEGTEPPVNEPSTLPEIYPSETIYPPAEQVPEARTWTMFGIPAALIVAAVVVTALIVRGRKKKSLPE